MQSLPIGIELSGKLPMTLQQMLDLSAVVQHGGFRAAARALDVSQTGLTKSVAKLEDELGLQLIQRTARGVILTDHGHQFMVHARAILSEAGRTEEWLKSVRQDHPKVLAFGVSLDPSLWLAPVVLADFRRAFPNTVVHLMQRSTSEVLNAIRDSRLELAVMRLPEGMESHDLRIDTLYTAKASIFARKGHPRECACSVKELADLDWVVLGDPGRPSYADESIRDLFLKQELGQPRVAAVLDSLFGAICMLLESDAVARLPRSILDHPLTSRVLSEIKVSEQTNFEHTVAVVSKGTRQLSAEAAQLVSMFKSFARMSTALGSHAQNAGFPITRA